MCLGQNIFKNGLMRMKPPRLPKAGLMNKEGKVQKEASRELQRTKPITL